MCGSSVRIADAQLTRSLDPASLNARSSSLRGPPTKLRAVPERFAIAQVTPHPWEDEHEVNAFAGELANELAERGHRLLVLAPSRSPQLVRESRKLIRAARERPEALFDPDGGVRVLGVGELLPLQRRRGALPSPPVDIARTIEEVLTLAPLDFVHVHEPFAPSASSVALRHSRALNVGSFHAPTERVLSTQVARRFVELFFGRLDARTASFGATREVMERFFPASYRLLRPGAASVERPPYDGPLRLAFCAQEERQALRLFLRALRRLPDDLDWQATVFSPTGAAPTGALRSRLRDRLTLLSADDTTENEVLANADVVVAASLGQVPAPGLLVRALGRRRRAGRRPAARLRGGRRGRPAVRARRRRRARRPARARRPRARAARAAARAAPRPRRGAAWPTRPRRSTASSPPCAARPSRLKPEVRERLAKPPDDRRRPPHAHRPLERLRDAGRGAARHRRASAASARSR